MAGAKPAVRVEGSRELVKTLRAAGADMADLKKVNAEIEDYLVPLVSAKAPRGPTGRLSASVRGSAAKDSAITRAGSTKIPYARPVHWGWPARHIRANRFAWDTIEQERPHWTEQYRAALRAMLARVRGAEGQ